MRPISTLLLLCTVLITGIACHSLADRSLGQEIKKQTTLEADAGRLVTVLAFSPDGKMLVGGEDNPGLAGMVGVWDVTKGKKLLTFKGHNGIVQAIAISPDGKTVASGDRSGEIKVFEAATGKEKVALKPKFGGEMFLALKFSADGTALTSASQISLTVWELSTGKEKKRSLLGSDGEEDENAYMVATISADGSLLGLGSKAGTIKLWDVPTGKEKTKLKGHKAPVTAIAFSKDGKTLVTSSQDSTIKIWDVDTSKEKATLTVSAPVTALAFAPDGKTLASGHKRTDTKTEVTIWDVATNKEGVNIKGGHRKDVFSVAFSPGGDILASGGEDEAVVLWQISPKTDK